MAVSCACLLTRRANRFPLRTIIFPSSCDAPIAAYNGGEGTIESAFAYCQSSYADFGDLTTIPPGEKISDTPLYKGVIANAGSLGVNPNSPDSVMAKYNEISNYPTDILATYATCNLP